MVFCLLAQDQLSNLVTDVYRRTKQTIEQNCQKTCGHEQAKGENIQSTTKAQTNKTTINNKSTHTSGYVLLNDRSGFTKRGSLHTPSHVLDGAMCHRLTYRIRKHDRRKKENTNTTLDPTYLPTLKDTRKRHSKVFASPAPSLPTPTPTTQPISDLSTGYEYSLTTACLIATHEHKQLPTDFLLSACVVRKTIATSDEKGVREGSTCQGKLI